MVIVQNTLYRIPIIYAYCVLLDARMIYIIINNKKYAPLHLIQVIITRSLLDNSFTSINSSFVTAIVLRSRPIMALLNLLVTFTLCSMISISESKDLFTVPRILLPFFEISKSSYGYTYEWNLCILDATYIYFLFRAQTRGIERLWQN